MFRVDKFIVPEPARAEFLARVRAIHALLRTLPGFVQDFVLEQSGGPGAFNVVTIAVWEDAKAVDLAKKIAAEHYKKIGFNPAEFMRRLNIHADLGNYAEVEV